MSLFEIPWSPTARQLRQFGLLSVGVLPVLGWVWGANWLIISGLVVSGCIIAIVSFVCPRLVRPLFVALTMLAIPLGLIVGELAMLLIYFFLFLPTGLCFRILHRDRLKLKLDRTAETYWEDKAQPRDVASYYRRY